MTVSLNPQIMRSVEQLGYQVTVGDVATQTGLELNLANQGLLTLASEAGGHLQVSDTGDIVYQFPPNFRTILRNRFWRLRLQALWQQIWKVLFYLIRISFGVILIASIILMMVAIVVILVAVNSKDGDSNDGDRGFGGGFFFFPTDIFWIFDPTPAYYQREERGMAERPQKNLNFLEAIFSFLFGDGNPNFNLEERRWQLMGNVIRNQGGAIAAEQVAPYLDNITALNRENEDYILPVLAKFNGYPQVSPTGQLIYTFPDLQVTAKQRTLTPTASYLQEKRWPFSQATSGQILLALGLGSLNIILALVLGKLLQDAALSIAFIAFVQGIYGGLLTYAIAFLGIPLGRYLWLQWHNAGIETRNQQRQAKAEWLTLGNAELQQKLKFAKEFAKEKVISAADIAYRTDEDLLVQEAQQSDKIDEEWRKRLESL